jgi:hypothetical protein
MGDSILLSAGNVGELCPESLLHLLHLFHALHRCRQPRLEDGLGIHGAEARPQALLDLAHDAILHGLDVGEAEEGTCLLGRAGDLDIDFHGVLSVSPSLGDIDAVDHAMGTLPLGTMA